MNQISVNKQRKTVQIGLDAILPHPAAEREREEALKRGQKPVPVTVEAAAAPQLAAAPGAAPELPLVIPAMPEGALVQGGGGRVFYQCVVHGKRRTEQKACDWSS